ncbi:Cis-zeatin O-glucosyltransferase 1 [Panicum miliaceum]|uniref:Cis-zeatin O-glucosyltransferase 1 n=1 Tax=Panicum miliaceum TaxID=4540 RepID=A0A3L6RJN6_PANMI|nr:Cis-zeatin O-glucosyltransferase 1 [Panicum miliaceum]
MFSDDLPPPPPPQQPAAPAPVVMSSSSSNHNSINDEKTDRGETAGSCTSRSWSGSVTALQVRVADGGVGLIPARCLPRPPALAADAGEQATSSSASGRGRHECLDWLDKKPPSSVLCVPFGTTSSLHQEQVRELAAALRASGQRFI